MSWSLDMLKAELIEIAESHGIRTAGMTKAKIIDALESMPTEFEDTAPGFPEPTEAPLSRVPTEPPSLVVEPEEEPTEPPLPMPEPDPIVEIVEPPPAPIPEPSDPEPSEPAFSIVNSKVFKLIRNSGGLVPLGRILMACGPDSIQEVKHLVHTGFISCQKVGGMFKYGMK